MGSPKGSQRSSTANTWIRLGSLLWKSLSWIWLTTIIGLTINVTASWLTTKSFEIKGTPIAWLIANPLITIALLLCLILLTIIALTAQYFSRTSSALTEPSLGTTKEQRSTFIRILREQYKSLLNSTLQGSATIELGLQARTDMVSPLPQLVFHRRESNNTSTFPLGTSITQVFDENPQGLLILGEPGSGKTTLLLELARELLLRAEDDPSYPIPVIVNLSSWTRDRSLLLDWAVDQLFLSYSIPRRLARAWLEHEQLMLLLDGLDEVAVSARFMCIEAINTYTNEYLVPVVVCSRSREYEIQQSRLLLPLAVEIQPLQHQQVIGYLKQAGQPMASFRKVVQTNLILAQLITTPLMLNIATLTYRNEEVKNLPQAGSAEEQAQQILTNYVERMLTRHSGKNGFSLQYIYRYLTWLARQMQEHHFTEFYLERLQPTWLSTVSSQAIYRWLILLIFGLIGGLFIEQIATAIFGLNIGIIFGLTGGLAFGLFRTSGSSWREIKPIERVTWSWKHFSSRLIFGLVSGLIFGLVSGLIFGLVSGLIFGLVGCLVSSLMFGFSGSQIGENFRFKPNQGIVASVLNALRVGLIFGFVGGLFFGVIGVLKFGLFFGLFYGLLSSLGFGLFFGQFFGGMAYLQHYLLRVLLWRNRVIPWYYVRFLEEMTDRILLQRIGGGYRFISPLLLGYFATLNTSSTPLSKIPLPDVSPVEGKEARIQMIKGNTMIIGEDSEIVLRIINDASRNMGKVEIELQPSAEYELITSKATIFSLPPESSSDVRFRLILNVTRQVAINYHINGVMRTPPLYVNVIKNNPYSYGNPVEEDAFFGREEELAQILQAVTKPVKQDIFVVGERRTGKTSLLYLLEKRLDVPFIPVYIYLAECKPQTDALLDEIIGKIIQKLIERDILEVAWKDYPFPFTDFKSKVGEIIHAAQIKVPDLDLVLLLDEADFLLEVKEEKLANTIDEKGEAGSQTDERVQRVLRSALQSSEIGSHFRAVVAGTTSLSTYMLKHSSPFFNHFRFVYLKQLSKEETRNLIVKPARELGISYSSHAIERIFTLSGGQPYYCQALCYEAFAYTLDQQKTVVDDEAVNVAENKIVNDLFYAFLSGFWQRANQRERDVLTALARGQGKAAAFSHSQVERLLDWQLINQTGKRYGFSAGLFEQWTMMALEKG
jgi:Cdc6-like AAA superfamily ATPase